MFISIIFSYPPHLERLIILVDRFFDRLVVARFSAVLDRLGQPSQDVHVAARQLVILPIRLLRPYDQSLNFWADFCTVSQENDSSHVLAREEFRKCFA